VNVTGVEVKTATVDILRRTYAIFFGPWVEVALLQKFGLFLGHPNYAAAPALPREGGAQR
jgi:hypothetical protein